LRGLSVLFALLVLLPAGCTPSSPDTSAGGGTTCTSGVSSECSADQPSLVTCPAGVAFDAGALNCTMVYLGEVQAPGESTYCCGSCALTPSSPACDGGSLLTCTPPYSNTTSSCTPLFDAAAGNPASPQWCCP
jgi:hypothetical protein